MGTVDRLLLVDKKVRMVVVQSIRSFGALVVPYRGEQRSHNLLQASETCKQHNISSMHHTFAESRSKNACIIDHIHGGKEEGKETTAHVTHIGICKVQNQPYFTRIPAIRESITTSLKID